MSDHTNPSEHVIDLDLEPYVCVKPDPGKYQWVQGKITGIDEKQAERTHTVGVPPLMPGVIIFVHGVNSEGEWYYDASEQFANGLNKRLGRADLKPLRKTEDDEKAVTHRTVTTSTGGDRIQSPIIPFYWGYKTLEKKLIKGSDQKGETPAYTDIHGNPLRADSAWGGGPFQNGGPDIPVFWEEQGFKKHVAGIFDLNGVNPVAGRKLCDGPPRLYYAHAARRLAYLIKDIRKHHPNEPVNIVAHSQGTIVTLCALFYLDRDRVRGPDTVLLNGSPYRFDTMFTDWLTALTGPPEWPEQARIETFANAAKIVAKARAGRRACSRTSRRVPHARRTV